MELFKKTTIKLDNGTTLEKKEILDVGSNYYFVENQKLYVIKKSDVKSFDYDEKTIHADNSKYLNKKEISI